MIFKPQYPKEFNGSCPVAVFGEAPGREEEIQGKPFVGRSGQLLTSLFSAAGIDRENLYISNVFWIRPPGNNVTYFFTRRPESEIVKKIPRWRNLYLREKYVSHLERMAEEIQTLKIEAILAVGSIPSWALRGEYKITEIAGTLKEVEIGGMTVKVFSTYHPAYVMRNRKMVETFISHLKSFKEIVKTNLK